MGAVTDRKQALLLWSCTRERGQFICSGILVASQLMYRSWLFIRKVEILSASGVVMPRAEET